ncbi:hypothetical protein jhhlp_004323 [Lomentospora prolificans]|uniref:Uncharacterized protein n=1 Tax=Lomentospora prolificans TaxID=41688 RepID=A0A2N3NBE6_9PEZI|nr:hypothetical protein jhhlp_004323 [Lomentospora prolificans]
MEAAAKQVRLLTQHILPEHPHHLSYSPDRRYRAVPDAKGFEEQIHRGLQYMTFVSEGERGVLLTRPYYDMREEPPAPDAHTAATSTSRSEKKPSTKMSLSDYKNKVKQQSQSPLPPNPTLKRGADEPTPRSSQERRYDNSHADSRKRDSLPLSKEPKIPGSKDSLLSARPSSLPPKPPPVRPPSHSPGARKRGSEEDDGSRPLKRSKPDLNGSSHDRSRPPKDLPRPSNEFPRRKDVPSSHANDHSPRTDSKPAAASSSAVNGRGILKAAMNQPHGASPNARSRAGSINGARPGSSSGSHSTNKLAPPSAASKSSVPPLLSPLHLSFNDSEATHKKSERPEKVEKPEKPEKPEKQEKQEKPEKPEKPEKFRREDNSDHHHPMAKSKSLDRPVPPPKRARSPFTLPPLLSPTLPPILEAELQRRKKTSPKEPEAKSPEHTKTIKKSTASKSTDKPDRERLIVTLKFPKRLAKRVQRLIALPGKNERSGSMDPPTQSQVSKKRPIPASNSADAPRDTPSPSATKRPKKSDGGPSMKPAPPSTPSRSSAGVSHVNTPGEASSTGPSSQGGSHPTPLAAPSVNKLRHLSDRYSSFGKKLKRARDGIFKNYNVSGAAAQQIPEPDQKLAIVTGIEAILAFMVGFKALFEIRRGERKTPDPMPWKSLLPMVSELQRHARAYHFPHTLLWMLQDIIMQEILACYYLMDLRNPANAQELQRIGGSQVSCRRQLPALYKQLEDAGEERRLPVLNPGASVEEIVSRVLESVKRWAENEDVDWQATLSGEEVLAGN